MGSRQIFSHLRTISQQHSVITRLGLMRNRQFSTSNLFDDGFSAKFKHAVYPSKEASKIFDDAFDHEYNKLKREANSIPEFKKSVEQLVNKAKMIHGVKEDFIYCVDDPETVKSVTAETIKEIRRRDPSFSLPIFLKEVQDIIRPALNALFKGDDKTLKKYCGRALIQERIIEREAFESRGIREAYESRGIFLDHKILSVSDVQIKDAEVMYSIPIISVFFHIQQAYYHKDKYGVIVRGGKDWSETIHYIWTLQQIPPEELEGAILPMWTLINVLESNDP